MLVQRPFLNRSWASQLPATKSTRSPGPVVRTVAVSRAGHWPEGGVDSLHAGNMVNSGVGGLFEALAATARPHPKSPPRVTAVPAGAVASSAYPRVNAVLSPSTTTLGGIRAAERGTNRCTTGAASDGTTVPTTTTTTVTATNATAGRTALAERQNRRSITGRSTR